MLDNFSNIIAEFLIKNGNIDKEKKIIYIYGAKVLILNVISFLSALLIGMQDRTYSYNEIK